jgi:phosphoserine phosphatase RsbU/P
MLEYAALDVLVAEDDPVQRHLIASSLKAWGFRPVVCADGDEAWKVLESQDAPLLMILDWMMPGVEGIEICRRLKAKDPNRPSYVILLTARGEVGNIVEGLRAGADDYILKPFHPEEFHARVRNGARLIGLQVNLAERIDELQAALAKVKQLQGLLPICTYCKKIRSDGDYWTQVESYFAEHADVRFSHGICPSCYESVIEPELQRLESNPTDD